MRDLGQGGASKGLYAGTDYQEPLQRFEAYANRLAGGGYSPEEFGRLANWVLPTLLPDRWLDRIIGRTVGLA